MKTLIIALAIFAIGAKNSPQESNFQSERNFTPARTEQAFSKLIKNKDANIIRNRQALQKQLLRHPKLRGQTKLISKFVASCNFNKGGLSGAQFGILKNVLGTREVHELYKDFGMDPYLASGYEGYYCEGNGTCRVDDDAICTSNC